MTAELERVEPVPGDHEMAAALSRFPGWGCHACESAGINTFTDAAGSVLASVVYDNAGPGKAAMFASPRLGLGEARMSDREEPAAPEGCNPLMALAFRPVASAREISCELVVRSDHIGFRPIEPKEEEEER